MSDVDAERSIVFITPITPQAQLFFDYISEQIGMPVTGVEPRAPRWTEQLLDSALILFDATALTMDDIAFVEQALVHNDDLTMAAFNVRDEDEAVDLLDRLYLQGVFYRTDRAELICKGIQSLLHADWWMSRHLMTRLIRTYRRRRINVFRPSCGLTQREVQILLMLGSGATNLEISKQLFISEHTVKSHLYNVFRKIEVRNRTQAIAWARENLGLPPVNLTETCQAMHA